MSTQSIGAYLWITDITQSLVIIRLPPYLVLFHYFESVLSLIITRVPIAQSGERRTLGRKVMGSIITWGQCCILKQDTSSPLLSTG